MANSISTERKRSEKLIHLIRHGKSDWETHFDTDHERGLNERGKNSTLLLSKLLKKNNEIIDLVYTSDSKRTLETLEILNQNKIFIKVIEEKKLYESNIDVYMNLIQSSTDELNSLCFIGHNPELESVCNFLIGISNQSIFYKFPTNAYLQIKFEVESWKNIPETKGKINFFWIPGKKPKL